MAEKKSSDPTISGAVSGSEYPEGTHPLRPLSQQTDSAENLKYADNKDKPDPTSVAQVQVKE